MKGFGSLVGVVWLFGVALLVFMNLLDAAVILFIGLAFYAIILYVFFHAPPGIFGVDEKPRRSRRKANRQVGKTYRQVSSNTRKALHGRR